MNILIACEDFRVGGAQIFCLNLGQALEHNHNVYMYSQYRDYVDSELVKQHYPKARILVPRVPIDRAVRKLDRLFYKLGIDWSLREHFVIRHIRATIKHFNIQLVHSNIFKSDYLFGRAIKDYPVPLIITMHGNYETFLENIRKAKGERILNYMQKVSYVISRIDALVYLTEKNLRVLDELDSNSISVINNLVKKKIYNGFLLKTVTSAFDGRQMLNIPDEHTVFGLVARGISEKGWEATIRAMLAMKDSKKVSLILVGDSSYLDNLKLEYSEHKNIYFVGYSSNPIKWINCFDVGLLPTVYGESLPTSIIEYLSCGKPVISTSIGEIKKMLSVNGRLAGCIIEIRDGKADHRELVESMAYLHNNSAKRQSLSRLALKASERFSMGRCVESYERVYGELLSTKTQLSNGDQIEKKNVMLIIPDLGSGGAQRSISRLSQLLSHYHHVFLCANNLKSKPVYVFGGTLINLDLPRSRNVFHKLLLWFRRIQLIRKLKRDMSIDTSISFLEGANYLNVLARMRDKVVLTVRGSLDGDRTIRGIVGFVRKKLLIPQLFKRGDQVIAVSDALREEMRIRFRIPEKSMVTIHNFYDIEQIRAKSKENIGEPFNSIYEKPVIMAAGRFHVQKNFEGLITVFSSIVTKFSCRLLILGDGDLRSAYLQHANGLGLKTCDLVEQSNVDDADLFLIGYQANPFKFMSKSKVFVISSNWEGFPNVLVEAMICGIPVVSTDCPTGPREILAPATFPSVKTGLSGVEYGEYGILMPMLSQEKNSGIIRVWSETLIELLSKERLRKGYAQKSTTRAEDFNVGNFSQKWEKVLA